MSIDTFIAESNNNNQEISQLLRLKEPNTNKKFENL